MKTLEKDFKGTQGEFTFSQPFHMCNQFAIGSKYGFVAKDIAAPSTNLSEEAEANARLFANSKKVLEAAIETTAAINNLVKMGLLGTEHLSLVEKLEKAINNSL